MDNKQQEQKQDQEQQETKKAPVESAEEKTPPSQTSEAKAPQKGSNTALIIIIIILAVIILGVGGYFGVKYVVQKFTSKATTNTTKTSGKVNVKTVIDALLYPGATIADQKQDSASGYKAELTLSSSDSVSTIKAYYTKLAADKSWKITKQGTSGANNYYMTATDGTFEAEIDVTKYEGYDTTDIRILISGDNLVSDGILISPTSVKNSATATAVATKTTISSAISDNYIISDSSTRVISESELTDLTPWQLKVARNEIYARHGREFVHKDLQCYFGKKGWYKADASFSESSLSATETKNIATIKAYEDKTGSPLASSDSGCDTNK